MGFEQEVDRRIQEALTSIERVPVAALIWGPDVNSGTAIAATRQQLKDDLTAEGHLARFSEDLYDPSSSHSILAQQAAHVEAFDIVFSLPGSPGSVAEIHDFARMPGIGHKIVTFVNQEWNDGYANQTLVQMQSVLSCGVQLYEPALLPEPIVTIAKDHVHRLQELFYLAGRRC